MSVESTPRLP
nr:unnamed protein product [Callosobruchus chinensis]